MDAYVILRDGSTLTWDEVSTCKDGAQLRHWHEAICLMLDDIESQIEARRQSDMANPEWLRKATGKSVVCRTMTRLIDRRLTALGLPLPPDVGRWERQQLAEARERIAQLELALASRE
jgi:hypothetical protein